jgi:hypothetical protein
MTISPIGGAMGAVVGFPASTEDTCPALEMPDRLPGTPPFLPAEAPVDPVSGAVPTLAAEGTEALGMVMIALHLGQLPFLPACWSPTVKFFLQPGQVTGIGIRAPFVRKKNDLRQTSVLAAPGAKSSRLVVRRNGMSYDERQ